MKKIILIVFMMAMISCGGGGGSSVSINTSVTNSPINENALNTITTSDSRLIIDCPGCTVWWDLIINGNNNQITIMANNTIDNYTHNASNCTVTVEVGTFIQWIAVTGDNNNFIVSQGLNFSFDENTGINNIVTYY